MIDAQKINSEFSIAWKHQLFCTQNAFRKDGEVNCVLSDLRPSKIMVVIDRGIVDANKEYVRKVTSWIKTTATTCFPLHVVQGGEEAKTNDSVVESILGAINELGMCRNSVILAIGGGAMLDAVGFATSTAHRGLHLIRMPSTSLSACDSGVGVKNGINKYNKKNFVGVFDPPYAVINDYDLLLSLDDRHWFSGMSEVIKVALVKSPELFKQTKAAVALVQNRDIETMAELMTTSATIHLKHITEGGDPFERLDARPLDFGHWAAHKLEQMTNHELTHGEAVSIGLAIDLQCSVELGHLDQKIADEAIALLHAFNLPTKHPMMHDPELIHGIEEFREHLGGRLTILLLEDIGEPIEVHELSESVVKHAIDRLSL
ncbi:MAG: 3-dehydroquinate synthase [Planctomycetes bacterium]|nr:3-dehydroquinate synthase [Planctomycetota bacterium]